MYVFLIAFSSLNEATNNNKFNNKLVTNRNKSDAGLISDVKAKLIVYII